MKVADSSFYSNESLPMSFLACISIVSVNRAPFTENKAWHEDKSVGVPLAVERRIALCDYIRGLF